MLSNGNLTIAYSELPMYWDNIRFIRNTHTPSHFCVPIMKLGSASSPNIERILAFVSGGVKQVVFQKDVLLRNSSRSYTIPRYVLN